MILSRTQNKYLSMMSSQAESPQVPLPRIDPHTSCLNWHALCPDILMSMRELEAVKLNRRSGSISAIVPQTQKDCSFFMKTWVNCIVCIHESVHLQITKYEYIAAL